MSEFTSDSVACGLNSYQFEDLPAATKRKLIRLMARISEKSYRRGYQHGVENGHRCCVDVVEWRFKRSLDLSPDTERSRGTSSIDRLYMEYGVLSAIGLPDYADALK